MYINDWSFLFVVSTILLTPGPTNTLLASSGISTGLRKSLTLLPCECLGYLAATSLWGVVFNTVAGNYPFVINLIKIASGIYIARLCRKLWLHSAFGPQDTSQPAIRGPQLFLATLLNPKAAIFAMALFPAQTWSSVSNYARVMASFLALVAAIGVIWIGFGSALMSGKIQWLEPRVFQRLATLTLFGFSGWLILSGLFG